LGPAAKVPAEATTKPGAHAKVLAPADAAVKGEDASGRRLQDLWTDLLSDEPRVACKAIDDLVLKGRPVVAELARLIEPMLAKADDESIRQSVADLGSPTYTVRRGATEQLAALGRRAVPMLRRALAQNQALEVRMRIMALLTDCDSYAPAGPGSLLMRAVYVLEHIDSPEAKKLLKAIADSPARPMLKHIRVGGSAVEAGFVPDKSQYVWGEKIQYFTLVVRSVSAEPLSWTEGGDYRGGRSESNKISAVDANGQAVPIPEMMQMGGLMGQANVIPGQVWIKMLPADRRLTFQGPGSYTVTGRRVLQGKVQVPVETSFQLEILPYSPERMGRVIEEFVAEIRSFGDSEPRGQEFTEPSTLSDAGRLHMAWAALLAIKDEAVLSQLLDLAKDGPTAQRAAALRYLAQRPGEKSFSALTDALRNGEPDLKAGAAEALGRIKTDQAVTA
jgi:hypothetical protein